MRLGCDLFDCCFTSTSSDTFPKDGIQLKWPIFPYRVLAKATNNFDQCNCLGKRLYCGKLKDGRKIAIQRFSNDKRRIFQQFVYENLISNILPHTNLVSIYGCSFHRKESLLVHEYLSYGSLAAHLQGEIAESRTLPWLTRLDIAIDTADALDYLHYYGIIHRNVKSSNILLDKNFCAKVANFHLSRKLPEGVSVNATHNTSDIIGTCGYVDPEYVSHGRLSVKNDVYSFGVVLCELMSSKLAKHWEGSDEESIATLLSRKIENQALDKLLDPRLGFQSVDKIKQMITAIAELALRCLQCPQELRPNMDQVLEILNGIRQGSYESNPVKALKIFHHDELEEATNHFDTCLGKGGFGTVYYGKLQDGREVAIKRFHHETDKTRKQFMKEIEILGLLRHQNLVSLYGSSSRHSNKHLLVYEYVSNDTLSKHLHGTSGSKLPWLTRLNIAIGTAIALVYLHDSVGTRAYIDPDYYESGRVSDRSDVYSFGVVLFELISSNRPSFMEGTECVTLVKFAISKILNKALEELVDPSLGFDSDKNTMEMITAVAELAFQCVHVPRNSDLP